MNTYLVRYRHTKTHTYGVLMVGDIMLFTLELPWLNNQQNISCIPPGDYIVNYLHRSGSGKFNRVYHVTDVPGRSGILFHAGNVPSQIQGCILPGMKTGNLAGQPAVLSSSVALEKMRSVIGKNSFNLKVMNYGRDS